MNNNEVKQLKRVPMISAACNVFASSDGKVYRLLADGSYKEITGAKNKDTGYLHVSIHDGVRKKTYISTMHRIIYRTFVGKIPSKKEVHHIDNNKENNRVENLMLVSRARNMVQGWIEGRFDKVSGAIRAKREALGGKNSNLTEHDVRQIRRLKPHMTNRELGYIFQLHPIQISRICNFHCFKDIE